MSLKGNLFDKIFIHLHIAKNHEILQFSLNLGVRIVQMPLYP